MQVQNITSKQQNFGMSIMTTKAANNILNKRLKEYLHPYFYDLKVAQRKNNLVNIDLYAVNETTARLGANIYPVNPKTDIRTVQMKESCLYHILNPLGFLEKVCKKADKMAKDIKNL